MLCLRPEYASRTCPTGSLLKPVLPLLRVNLANAIMTTESVGLAMLNAVHFGHTTPVLKIAAIAQTTLDAH